MQCVFERMKIYEKEAGVGPFFLKKNKEKDECIAISWNVPII